MFRPHGVATCEPTLILRTRALHSSILFVCSVGVRERGSYSYHYRRVFLLCNPISGKASTHKRLEIVIWPMRPHFGHLQWISFGAFMQLRFDSALSLFLRCSKMVACLLHSEDRTGSELLIFVHRLSKKKKTKKPHRRNF